MQNKKNTSRQNNSSSRSRNNDKSPTFGYYNETSDEKECPDCNGTGYDPYDGGQCERCAGTGMISR